MESLVAGCDGVLFGVFGEEDDGETTLAAKKGINGVAKVGVVRYE